MSLGSCSFVPPFLLERIAASSHDAAEHCRATLARDQELREGRVGPTSSGAPTRSTQVTAGGAAWVVHTADNGSTLPGDGRALGRRSGRPATPRSTRRPTASPRRWRCTARSSRARRTTATVRRWCSPCTTSRTTTTRSGTATQLVFGDGDGKIFGRFTKPVDVLGHEFTHAVTQFTAGLTYQGQSGRAQRVGLRLLRRVRQAAAARPDRRPRPTGWSARASSCRASTARALRDMAHPGTAYDDPTLGKDPQVGDMADYVDTTDDNGGVHTNSGIPNRAFYLAATAIGGDTWEGAGQIWYAALTGGRVGADTDFAGFAAATIAAAGDHADAVRQAWTHRRGRPGRRRQRRVRRYAGQRRDVVAVRRTGGIAGRTIEGSVDLAADDPRASAARDLVDRLDLSTAEVEPRPFPDAFSYTFEVGWPGGHGARSSTLSDDQRALADLLLRRRRLTVSRARARSSAAFTCSVVHGIDRQLGVGLLDQQLELGAAEQHAAGAGVPELLDHAEHAAAGGVDDPAVHQLVVDRAVEQLVVARRRASRSRAPCRASRSVKKPSDIATVVPMKPTLVTPCDAHLLGDHVGRGAAAGCRRRPRPGRPPCGTSSCTAAGSRRRARSTPRAASASSSPICVPALRVLQRGQLGEVDRAEHQLAARTARRAGRCTPRLRSR